jgi:hypothetical protein
MNEGLETREKAGVIKGSLMVATCNEAGRPAVSAAGARVATKRVVTGGSVFTHIPEGRHGSASEAIKGALVPARLSHRGFLEQRAIPPAIEIAGCLARSL